MMNLSKMQGLYVADRNNLLLFDNLSRMGSGKPLYAQTGWMQIILSM